MKKISFIGARSFPGGYGGFETFVYEATKRLMSEYEIVVIADEIGNLQEFSSAENFTVRKTFFKKARNPLLFYFESLFLARRTDVIYCCGAGVGFGAIFFSKNIRNKLVTNLDGIGWKRGKWSKLKQIGLRYLFALTIRTSKKLIADSHALVPVFEKEFGAQVSKKIFYCAYGANVITPKDTGEPSEKYFLVVARVVPENNLDVIIDAFANIDPEIKLYIVGDSLDNNYGKYIHKRLSQQVNWLGPIYDMQELQRLRDGAIGYIHGHSVGGTNPALVEALASGALCLAHDNMFNKEVLGNSQYFWHDSISLSVKIREVILGTHNVQEREKNIDRYYKFYTWSKIVDNLKKIIEA